jgi:low temperature requirement protein LtrA
VRLALADLRFCFGRALRVVGIALTAVAWVSVLASEAQQNSDTRALLAVAAAGLGVLIGHLFTGLPPSARVAALVRGWHKDIAASLRDVVRDDPTLRMDADVVERTTALAIARIEAAGRVPHDRRAWLRIVARLALSE